MNKNPLNLPPKAPDKHCNARTPNGYCKNLAGFRTGKLGEGRCWLHGGMTPAIKNGSNLDLYTQTIYTKFLPTNLAIELAEIKVDPTFSSLKEEYGLLKLIVQGLISNLPADLALMYGKLVCGKCGMEMDSSDEILVQYDKDNDTETLEKRLKLVLQTIRDMANVFDKVSKAEERQKRFVQMSDLEGIVIQWGKILTDHLGDDPRINEIQKDMLTTGFFRTPGQQDDEKMAKFHEIQTKLKSKYKYGKRKGEVDTIKDVYVELNNEINHFDDASLDIEEAEIVKPKLSAKEILAEKKKLKKKKAKKK